MNWPARTCKSTVGPGSVPAPAQPATAPAQRVEVTDQLSADLNWDTLEFTEVGFGDNRIVVPGGLQYYFTTVSMTYNDKTFDVEVELSFDITTGGVRAVFQSIDPGTLLPPDVLTGFLPPEDGTGIGKGFIGFTIRPRADLTTGTELRNVALISFNLQTLIATNQIDPQDASAGTDPAREALNTIDADAPTSTVLDLPAILNDATFELQWSFADLGAGVVAVGIYVSDNGGPFQPFLTGTTETSAMFTGEHGHTYSFYSIATDGVGLRQPAQQAARGRRNNYAAHQFAMDGHAECVDLHAGKLGCSADNYHRRH